MNDAAMQTTPLWPDASAEDAGFDPGRLAEAVTLAETSETEWPRDMYVDGRFVGSVHVNDRPPYDRPMGPVVPRGGPAGLVLRGGRIVARWGDPGRQDMTFSIAKSYLAILTGVAVDMGLIGSIDEPVGQRVDDGGFEGPHNGAVTWRHLLEQTSEWHGTLFERPDSVDWNRKAGSEVPSVTGNADKGTVRELQAPGTHFEYNDVRVNRLALSLLRVFRRPLPDVLAEHVLEPMGVTGGWAWHGYDTSWVEVDGRRMQSVPGGGHWGGGLVIDSHVHARVGELVLHRGHFHGRKILSPDWVDAMLTPSALEPTYGLLWWLNTDGRLLPGAPETSVFAMGGGSNIIWVDRPRDLVVVVRWMHKPVTNDFVGLVTRAMTG
ncbi:MAG: CubicO group peptidase, beta-lactamase class C family [Rhodobacteraceae bacterium HLUCCA24]|nr:MAG: CubicO group peptidase, beta-lactamase class C family [Rhodobacteraceae bacterium HLUCCA24]